MVLYAGVAAASFPRLPAHSSFDRQLDRHLFVSISRERDGAARGEATGYASCCSHSGPALVSIGDAAHLLGPFQAGSAGRDPTGGLEP